MKKPKQVNGPFKSDFLLNENIYKKLSEINTDNLKNHDIFDIMIR